MSATRTSGTDTAKTLGAVWHGQTTCENRYVYICPHVDGDWFWCIAQVKGKGGYNVGQFAALWDEQIESMHPEEECWA